MALSAKKQRFVEEYLLDGNATASAKRAGFANSTAEGKAPGWVAKSREKSTCVEVWDAVNEAKQKRSEKTGIDAEYVLQRHAAIDQMDFMDLFDEKDCMLPIRQWPKIFRQYLNGFEIAEIMAGSGDAREVVGILKKVKWPDKIKNLELLGKHVSVGAYSEKLDLGDQAQLVPFAAVVARVDK